MRALGQTGHRMIFIHQCQIMELIVLLDQHTVHSILEDDSDFARMGRIPSAAIRDRAGDHQTRAILMLQSLTPQCGAPGGCPKQKTPRTLIGGSPNEITHALKPEHGVVDVDRQHRQAMHTVARGGRDPGTERTRLVDPFFE